MTAPVQSCQPIPEPVRQHSPLPWSYRPWDLDDWGWIRADDGTLAATARGDASETHDRHRAAGTDPYGPNAAFIIEAVNSYATLKAKVEQLESNARVQAKLLADTGRRVEEMAKALKFYRDEWRMNGDGDTETPGLSRSWMEPTDALHDDEGRKARGALEAKP